MTTLLLIGKPWTLGAACTLWLDDSWLRTPGIYRPGL